MDKKQQILDISKKLGLSHIGSCLSILPILEEIYAKKKLEDKVILDNAHSHLAHTLFLTGTSPEYKIKKYGIHCDRRAGCDASGGSLGHGMGIAIGMALVDRKRDIYVIVSDGSMQEGSNWEALRIKDNLGLDSIKIYTNFNGFSAVAQVDLIKLKSRMMEFDPDIEFRFTDNGEGFEGVQGHYRVL